MYRSCIVYSQTDLFTDKANGLISLSSAPITSVDCLRTDSPGELEQVGPALLFQVARRLTSTLLLDIAGNYEYRREFNHKISMI
ncbi:hypothetical protein PAXRUDRAFT_825729 [Paxillus rubicundulus Ve08.2h10]|uniref:Uncharacterized protein n=1 Tax=Paxillus rubicundulus Ve08.2h10 TaxID=930991 RepID=A0A0D0E5H6_9AGAM|nr:hypothetical protein PAXRUDRAFT_825729 [Paxillus rubicundulus Ve08.2h10]